MSTARRVFKNFLSLTVAEIICRLLGFLAVAYLARVLGVEGFGKIGFAFAIVSYFFLLVNLGLDTFGTREIARNKEKIVEYTNNIVTIKLFASTISFLLLLIFALVIPKPMDIKKLILFYGLTLLSTTFAIEWVFMGIEKMEIIAISRVIKQIIYVFFIILLVRSSQQILLVPWILFISGVIVAGILLYCFMKEFGSWRFEIDWKVWRSILKESLPLIFSFIMIQIFCNFDTVMLGFSKGDKVVGWYSAAYKIVLLFGTLRGLYYNSIFPLISRYYKSSMEKLEIVLTHTSKLAVTIALPLGIGSVLVGKPLMQLIYGEQFNPGIIAFQILIWSNVISWINCAYGNSLMACDRQKKYMIGMTLAAASNILLNSILIPHFSLVGASTAIVITEMVIFIYMYFQFSKLVKIEFYRFLPRPFMASILMGVFLFLTKNHLSIFLWIGMAMVLYFILLFAFRGITFKEVRTLREEIFSKR